LQQKRLAVQLALHRVGGKRTTGATTGRKLARERQGGQLHQVLVLDEQTGHFGVDTLGQLGGAPQRGPTARRSIQSHQDSP